MRSRELQQYLASITGRPLSEIDQRCRPLRDISRTSEDQRLKISTGPRGQSAPHMEIAEGMFHFLTLVSRRPADALDVAQSLFSNCRLIRHPDHPGLSEAFRGEARLLASFMVVAMNKGYETAGFKIRSFELQEDGQAAWMTFDRRSLTNVRFLFSSSDELQHLSEEDSDRLFRSIDSISAGNRFVIGADHLRSVGKRILLERPLAEATSDDDLVVATSELFDVAAIAER
ncbi:hypothetical protein [Mesorhizobium helmanticense]|uniref:Uncharacterized protein n=1 Tax=Mesorhizobium helmanticense TaxID=1776423 RepID=A0A2T4IP38_9HYPH|nr:hypothetical protein [Mesorhizobium helmanticense]PTE07385.1 hypothetical protein C9427_27180 [Mesorhizobium helmanticense]